MYAGLEANLGLDQGSNAEKNLMSGGTGNDRMYGSRGADVLFGGPGHDFLYGGYGADTNQLHGEDGDDEIWASQLGDNEIWGGAGDDMILSGVVEAGGFTKADFPLLPRRPSMPLFGDQKRDEYPSYGSMDIEGGDGNDYIIGGQGSNDIFGGKGDDVIYGM